MQLIMELSKYIYVLNFGTLLAQGTPMEIRENEEVNKAYMGEEGSSCF
jgi:branched-chain amino acid transport system ATP-binding protein